MAHNTRPRQIFRIFPAEVTRTDRQAVADWRQAPDELAPLPATDPALDKAKRVFDFTVAALSLALLLPLMALLAVLIKLTSPGPLIYRCAVVGHLGRPFALYKFRTMVPGASRQKIQLLALNEADWPMFKMRRDPRTTRFGRFLRRHSLDELPQLWNVIKGDMSLVGPRPVLQSEWLHFTPRQRRKLAIMPGAICLWHLKGQPRNLDDWIALDLAYHKNRSMLLDLKILAGGLLFVIRGLNH